MHEFSVIAYTVKVLHKFFVEIYCLNNRFNIEKWKVILRTQMRFYLPNYKKRTNVKGFDNILKVLVIRMNCFTEIKETHFWEMRFWGILYGFPSKMVIELMFKEVNLMLWIHDTIWDWLGRWGLTMFCLELNIYFKLFIFDVIMNYFPETYLYLECLSSSSRSPLSSICCRLQLILISFLLWGVSRG